MRWLRQATRLSVVARLAPVALALAAVSVAAQVGGAARPTRAADSVAVSAGGWSIVPTPKPAGGWLEGVSCVSAADCTAVGYDGTWRAFTLVEHWDGTAWSIIPSPSAHNNSSTLNGVSCVSATDCTAVGGIHRRNTYVGPLAEHWNGTVWSIVHSPNPAGNPDAYAVSCVSARDCTAVGAYEVPVGRTVVNGGTVVERWNGAAWSVTPSPRAGSDGFLSGVSCVSATDCTAVGVSSGGSGSALVEHWNGAAWSTIPSPSPAAAPNAGPQLNAVSCVNTNDCNAVGLYGAVRNATLAEHWNGTEWSIVHSPTTPGGGGFVGISCVSARDCTAVGSSGANGNTPLIEHWNGATWSIVHSPKPAGGGSLFGVSCVSANHCTAVGHTGGTPTEPLIEQESS